MYYLFNRYQSSRTAFVWISESVLIFLAELAATAVRTGYDHSAIKIHDPLFIKTGVLTFTYITAFYYFDLYRSDMYRPSRLMSMHLIKATLVATIALFSIFYVIPSLKTWRLVLLANTLLLPPTVLLWRTILSRLSSFELPSKSVLIIGSGDLAKKIGSQIYKDGDYGLKLVGFIDDDPAKLGQSIVNPGVIGGYGDIGRIVKSSEVDRIIVALSDRRAKLPMSVLLDCKLHGITIEEGETFHERMTGKIPLDHLKPSWMVFSEGFKSLRSRKITKRFFDVSISIVCLIALAPLFLIISILIKLDSRGPAIYRQTRVGEHGKGFNIYKFRSLKENAEEATGPVWASAMDTRFTRVGRVIRKLRLDELPQLLNVIKGDMSFVGPRPERPYFVDKLKEVIPYYEMRTIVKPGITGWAQIKYPYGISLEDAIEKLQYDIYYIKNMSPILDLLIFFETIKVVLTRRGAI